MMEMKVILDFACCSCDELVSVTVKCEGTGLALSGRTVARVNVPCPSCGTVHCVDFEPNGTVRAVNPYTTKRPALEPSVN
jgi:hypothetical protein